MTHVLMTLLYMMTMAFVLQLLDNGGPSCLS